MLKSWTLGNFKSVRGKAAFTLRPLTVFAGPNSSGKSTVLQSLLILVQTLSSKVAARPIVLNGHLVRLGAFEDIHAFDTHDPVIVSCELEVFANAGRTHSAAVDDLARARPPEQLSLVSCELSFGAAEGPSAGEGQSELELVSCSVRSEGSGGEPPSYVTVRRALTESVDRARALFTEPVSDQIVQGLGYEISLDPESLETVREPASFGEPVGCLLRHFLPNRMVVRFDATEADARLATEAICEAGTRFVTRRRVALSKPIPLPDQVVSLVAERLGDRYRYLLEPDRQPGLFDSDVSILTLQTWVERVGDLTPTDRSRIRRLLTDLEPEIHSLLIGGKPKRYQAALQRIAGLNAEALEYLEGYFSGSVRYLGPLREEPKPVYPMAPSSDPTDIGIHGEYTAAVLDLHKNVKVSYIPPDQAGQGRLASQPVVRPLIVAVRDWLKYIGVVENLATRDRGKFGHELRVATAGVERLHDLMHVGVGVSQVLPIVVMCLLAPRDTTLIFEQPELHLHPRVQTLLADFFVSAALTGKQCLIETHSEYLINRLRVQIATAPADSVGALVQIYFVQKREGTSHFTPVQVNQYGAIPDWPEGFFEESQREAEQLLMAELLKRRGEQVNGRPSNSHT